MEKNLGHATAYGYAKSKGYSGTEDEFAQLMADYASVGQSAAQSAEQAAASATSASGSAAAASQAAQTAISKASEAVTAAGTATIKASEASTSADTASAAATSAITSAQTATTAAATATTKASEAAESAVTATTAKTDAESARDAAAQSASAAAESARTLTIDSTLTQAGQAADAKVVGDGIGELKSALNQLKTTRSGSGNGGVNYDTYNIVSGKTYVFKNTGANYINFYYRDSGSTGSAIFSSELLGGESRILHATENHDGIRAYFGGDGSFTIENGEVTDNTCRIDTIEPTVAYLDDVIEPLIIQRNGQGNGPKNYNYNLIAGQVYRFINKGSNIINFSYIDNGVVGSLIFPNGVAGGETLTLIATENHDGVKAYFNGISSFTIESGEVTTLHDYYDNIHGYYEFANNPIGGSNYPFKFKKGMAYFVTNNATDACSVYTRSGNENIETISSSLGSGSTVMFVPKFDADFIRVYYPVGTDNRNITITYDETETKNLLGQFIPNINTDFVFNSNSILTMTNVSHAYGLFDALLSEYPNNITKTVLGKDESNTYDINCYTINFGGDSTSPSWKKNLEIVWICAIHGNEKDSTRACYNFIKSILENNPYSVTLATMLSYVTWYVIPVANPWGYQNNTRYNVNDVNLNRNFPYNWKLVDKTVDPYNYGGETASSEAETVLLENFLSAHTDALLAINHHGSESITDGNKVYYTRSNFWSDIEAQYNSFRVIDNVVKYNNSWLVTDKTENATKNLGYSYPRSEYLHGTMEDYFNQVLGIHGYLVEIASATGNDYPNSDSLSLQNIQATVIGNILIGAVIQNQSIKYADKKYPYIVSE